MATSFRLWSSVVSAFQSPGILLRGKAALACVWRERRCEEDARLLLHGGVFGGAEGLVRLPGDRLGDLEGGQDDGGANQGEGGPLCQGGGGEPLVGRQVGCGGRAARGGDALPG